MYIWNHDEIKHWFKLLSIMMLSNKSTALFKKASMEMK